MYNSQGLDIDGYAIIQESKYLMALFISTFFLVTDIPFPNEHSSQGMEGKGYIKKTVKTRLIGFTF